MKSSKPRPLREAERYCYEVAVAVANNTAEKPTAFCRSCKGTGLINGAKLYYHPKHVYLCLRCGGDGRVVSVEECEDSETNPRTKVISQRVKGVLH